MDHDDTSPDDHINLPHLEYEQDRSIAHDRPHRNVKAPTTICNNVAIPMQVAEEVSPLKTDYLSRGNYFKKDSEMWGCGYVAHHDLELEQLDIKTAFLHGDLEEEIYMSQPEGFVVQGKEDYVCKLQKSLYGLKQSPRQWYKRLDSFMVKHDFSRNAYDCCVYYKKALSGSLIYLLLYVDDMLLAAKDMEEVKKLKILLNT
ncbi:reverse transcriptase [Tanacetum coccineum]